jgi:hypothetical protein
MKISLKLFASISTLIFLCAANAQTAKPEVEVAPVASASAPAPQEPINFDGVYQRRGPNGNCCYARVDPLTGIPTGVLLLNADLIISGKSGTFEVFSDPKISKDLAMCGFQKAPVEVMEKHGKYIVLLIKKSVLKIHGCTDELGTFYYNKIDGKEGFSNPKRPEVLIYIKKED